MIQGCPDNDQLLSQFPSYSVLFYNIIATEESQEVIKMGKHCLIPSCNPNCRSELMALSLVKKLQCSGFQQMNKNDPRG